MKFGNIYKASIFFIILSFFVIPVILHNKTIAKTNHVNIVRIKDYSINPITADYITKAIDISYSDNAECLIIELDTPGGLLDSTRTIVKKMLSSKVPVVVYIYPGGSRAGSAGVFITYASHVAAMAPSTNIGAAHPVKLGGRSRSTWSAIKDLIDSFLKRGKEDNAQEEEQKRTETEETSDIVADKILNDTIAFVKTLARKRNRNEEWAERSVSESLSITEEEALKNNIIEIIAKDEQDLLEQLDGKTVLIDNKKRTLNIKYSLIHYIDMNFRQRFLNVLANPNIAYILLLLGFYGLLYEVTHPGIGFPGIAGAICIILAFFSMQTLPTNYAGLALIILAVILFIAEVKAPGFGLLTLGGIVCMVLGSLILFESPSRIMRVSLTLVISFSLATAFITVFLVGAVVRAHKTKIVSGKEGLIGEIGQAETNINIGKVGKIFVHGEIWDATSSEDIKIGENIKVVKVEGMKLVVSSLKKGG